MSACADKTFFARCFADNVFARFAFVIALVRGRKLDARFDGLDGFDASCSADAGVDANAGLDDDDVDFRNSLSA